MSAANNVPSKDQEEFGKQVKKLYALADKMGLRLTIKVTRKNKFESAEEAKARREPGEN